MPLKEARTRFRDSAQEYNEKRVATMVPIIFFETMEISWLPPKSVKDWPEAMKLAPHLKSRSNKKFRGGLVQVCDFMCSGKTPKNWVCKAPPPAVAAPPATHNFAAAERAPGSPRRGSTQAPPAKSRPRSAPSADTPHDRLASEQARAKDAILGGVSRDERHRRRVESMLGGSDAGAARSAAEGRLALRSGSAALRKSAPAAESVSRAATGSEGPQGLLSAAESEPHQRRHTRSRGQAELGATDLDNLALRKAAPPRRAASTHTAPSESGKGAESSTGRVGKQASADAARGAQSAAPTVEAAAAATSGSEQPARSAATAQDAPPPQRSTSSAEAEQAAASTGAAPPAPSSAEAAPHESPPAQPDAMDVDAAAVAAAASEAAPPIDAEVGAEASSGPRAAEPQAEVAAAAVSAPSGTPAASVPPTSADEVGGAMAAAELPSTIVNESAEADADATPDDTVVEDARDGDAAARRSEAESAQDLGARRSRRDAPGRRTALELMHGSRARDDTRRGRRTSEARSKSVGARCVLLAGRAARPAAVRDSSGRWRLTSLLTNGLSAE